MIISIIQLFTLLHVSQSIIDPRSVLDSLPSYKQYIDLRQKYVDITQDYPYGVDDFDCPKIEPTPGGAKDIHHLRPSDIKIVAALGDSLTAGREALTTKAMDFGTEYRGISFDAGGDEGLKTRTTIPNILSKFSPSVIGSSKGTRKGQFLSRSLPISEDFNVAISGARSIDLMSQVEELERRLNVSSNVNMNEDWKLITLFIGSNDLCAYQSNMTETSAESFGNRIREVLIRIKKNIPRSFINLLPPFNVFALLETHESVPFCVQFHKLACPSLFELSIDQGFDLFNRYVSSLIDLSNEMNDETFAVTLNPALNLEKLPKIWGTPHYALLAVDCFHFSGMTHDVAAKIVWENLMSSENDRTNASDFSSLKLNNIKCPLESCPYLYTNKTKCTPTKPSLRVLINREVDSTSKTDNGQMILMLIGIVMGLSLLALGTLMTIVRFRRRYKKKMNERTPLLTAHYYETSF